MVVVRGNNLHPMALQTILHRFPEVAEFQVEIDQSADLAAVRISVEPGPGVEANGLLARIERVIRDELFFRAVVCAVPPGSLPRAEMKARRWVRKPSP
jgi:phenylacetate-CoA ligase